MPTAKLIYLDNAATTAMNPKVLEAMMPFLTEKYGNASSIHGFGADCNIACDNSRAEIAKAINATEGEIYFTSGGTESDNWAIRSAAYARQSKGKHIITSNIEHHAVWHTCMQLAKEGFEVTYLEVDENGIVSIDDLRKAIRPDTILITIMYANNEIGTIQPIREIGKIARENDILFHTDAVQAFCHIPIDVIADNIDLLSASAHKIHGPKGVGMLYIRKKVKMPAFMHGGAQERGRRAGTLNVPGIVGFGKATELAQKGMAESSRSVSNLRDYLIDRLLKEVPYSRLNGDRVRRLPGNANISFRFVEGESLLMLVDSGGVCVSTGSACASGSLDPSHVLLAIGLPHEIAHGSLRLSLSEDTTKEELDVAIDVIKRSVETLRRMSPLYEDAMRSKECV